MSANVGGAWKYEYDISDGLLDDFEQQLEQVRQQLQEAMAELLPSTGSVGAAAAPPAVEAAAATAQPMSDTSCTPHSTQQQQQQQQLRLASFSSDWLFLPPFLAVLPAASLTALDLDLGCSSPQLNVPKWIAALTSLSNLQALRLSSANTCPVRPAYKIPARCLLALPQLSRLTALTLAGQHWSLKGLPEALQQLLTRSPPLLHQVHLLWWVQPWRLDIRHLTRLTELKIEMPMPHGAVLPAQLQCPTMQICKPAGSPGRREHKYASNLAAVMPLQQLQELTLTVNFPEPEVLLPLGSLPALQQLCLLYNGAKDAAAQAAAWPLLPQLRELLLHYFDAQTEQSMVEMLAAMAALTRLTKLQMPVTVMAPVPGQDSSVEGNFFTQLAGQLVGYPVCSSLAGMTGLKDLQIDGAWRCSGTVSADCPHLPGV
jgi:hypothetical protein